jgi:hypothetical protein
MKKRCGARHRALRLSLRRVPCALSLEPLFNPDEIKAGNYQLSILDPISA